jgi:hypothetical protein
VKVERPEANDESRSSHVDAAATRLGGDDDAHALRRSDSRREGASIERLEPKRSPNPAGDQQHRGKEEASVWTKCGESREAEGCDHEQRKRDPYEVRYRKANAKTGTRSMSWMTLENRHGAASPFSWASFAGPIPGTASSSSTDENAPCCCR